VLNKELAEARQLHCISPEQTWPFPSDIATSRSTA